MAGILSRLHNATCNIFITLMDLIIILIKDKVWESSQSNRLWYSPQQWLSKFLSFTSIKNQLCSAQQSSTCTVAVDIFAYARALILSTDIRKHGEHGLRPEPCMIKPISCHLFFHILQTILITLFPKPHVSFYCVFA